MIVTKKFHFSSAHILPKYSGKCSRLHGHNYVLEVAVERDFLNEQSMVLDFADLKAIVQPLIDRVDHRFLVSARCVRSGGSPSIRIEAGDTMLELPPDWIAVLPIGETTAEEICLWFVNELNIRLPVGVFARQIRLWETEDSSALYARKP